MDLVKLAFLVYQVIVIITVIHVVLDNRQPAKTIAWALIIIFAPVIGIIAYLFFGVNTRRERLVSRRSLDELTRRSMFEFVEQRDLVLPENNKLLIDQFINQSLSLPFQNNRVDFLLNGYEFFPSLLRDIAAARHHIHLDIYIFEDDPLGNLIADALIAKAREGVEVRIIYDDVGCWSVKNRFFQRMIDAGVMVEPFLQVRFPRLTSKANYRNHRKLFIIDGHIGYVGGMNIALRYVKGGRTASWRDTMTRIEGLGVISLQRIFLIDWYFTNRTLLNDRTYYRFGGDSSDKHYGDILLQGVACGPTSPVPEIMQGFVRIIMNAKRYVYIETPYFLPTGVIRFALISAALAGVDVRLLVPRHGDTWLIGWASRSYLREMVETGVNVMLYDKGFLHSKIMVSDDIVCTCGSTNMDFRSFEDNFESNVFFYGEEVSERLRDIYLDDEKNAIPLSDFPERMNPTLGVRLWESLTRLLSPLL
ncbi:cardiolipin synthase [Prevotella sp. E13-27]|uniref:cardiolipin synthase n=1 Tax=Prevotella sp. E13-27 TaxID=2938122 RepID=UPI00200A921A|nr:cardiolipin synthase [Prevotella sp. E13-27]MCK8621944.1 cardiolipin synthase [Prevotella sp. E13-27]